MPEGRTLHLVDLENLVGGPFAPAEVMLASIDQFNRLAVRSLDDLVWVGTNPRLVLQAKRLMPQARCLTKGGPDGADLALLNELDNPTWIAERFDRVVIGSGDGIFSDVAREMRTLGVRVGVVARRGTVSLRLGYAVDFVRLFRPVWYPPRRGMKSSANHPRYPQPISRAKRACA
ncbi:MAG: hypothetical protein CME26_16050 [Gemmatimonadetes bacterium]|nr:hypothetical protein [Gemmatimonadota bacterium]